MKLNSVRADIGMTLLEVIFALLIVSILLTSTLSLLIEQWKGANALKNQLEAHYASMTAGKTIAAEIRRAKTVQWLSDRKELTILPLPDDDNPTPTQDSYFIADLDNDGTKDLYWKHLGVSQPIASYLTSWESLEVEPGLWEVSLHINVQGQNASWKMAIRQRVSAKISSVCRDSRRVLSVCSSLFC
ncbi:prepilin-type cleavage/methylation domain-containing protein [Desulfosporosinus sp. SB140]|uniref:prepilin-type cleavage/methylation domain-containing protein n=1 Tax=Desulfosporosinus paludis TaxID=3115649 RepID=UPI003890FF1C